MTTCLGKSCSFGLPRVPFVNCCQFMYLDLRAGCWICLYQFPSIAYPFTLWNNLESRYKRLGNNTYTMRQTACLVVNPITLTSMIYFLIARR